MQGRSEAEAAAEKRANGAGALELGHTRQPHVAAEPGRRKRAVRPPRETPPKAEPQPQLRRARAVILRKTGRTGVSVRPRAVRAVKGPGGIKVRHGAVRVIVISVGNLLHNGRPAVERLDCAG